MLQLIEHSKRVGVKAPIKTDKGKRMKESYGEGLAKYTSLESCGDYSNGIAEALTEGSIGGILSSEITNFWIPTTWLLRAFIPIVVFAKLIIVRKRGFFAVLSRYRPNRGRFTMSLAKSQFCQLVKP